MQTAKKLSGGELGDGPQQLAVLYFNRFVALAGAVPQSLDVQYFYSSARVLYRSRFLQGVCNAGHARSTDTKHLCQKFLREGKVIASRQIAGAQQPAA